MITELTKEQEAQMKDYVKKWTEIGLSTKPTAIEENIPIIENFYRIVLEKEPPKKFFLEASPIACWNRIVKECKLSKEDAKNFVWPYFSGNMWAGFFSFYTYCNEVLNIKYTEPVQKKFDVLKQMTNFSLIYPLDDICVICDTPRKISVNKAGDALHNEKGPAVEYSDGFCVYSLNGVRVPKEIVETPWDKIDCKKILTETNAEVRREIVRKVGIERIISELGAEVIDKKDDYELLMLNLGDGRRRPYLKMKNPSLMIYHIEGVSPECKTVNDALKFRAGVGPNDESGLNEWNPSFKA
jgi:hypothetical protein